MSLKPLLAVATTALASVILASCGGGGGSDSGAPATTTPMSNPPGTNPPTAATGPDPLLSRQWHLRNTGQLGGQPGQDLRLSGLAEDGGGVLVAVIDGSISLNHPDLASRFVSRGHFSYRTGGTDTSPPPAEPNAPTDTSPGGVDDAHGTAVAGIIAAAANNSEGGQGVAPGASLIAFDAIVEPSNTNISDALSRAINAGSAVVNNSWGPVEPAGGGSRSFERAPEIWRAAVDRAITTGRNGLGSVVVFAAGNGGAQRDRADYNQFTNDPRVIAVGAVNDRGLPVNFSEPGMNVLVSGFSGSDIGFAFFVTSTADIFTTDIPGERGYADTSEVDRDYSSFFDGTSAAAPMVSGVAARMIGANPLLSWRDIRWLLAKTARFTNSSATLPSSLVPHGFHPQAGFGIVDAGAAVSAARAFGGLGPEKVCDSGPLTAGQPIPDGSSTGITLNWTVPAACAGLQTIETVELLFSTNHVRSGDLQLTVRAPNGYIAQVSDSHTCNGPCRDLINPFSIGISRLMGEPAQGQWQFNVADRISLATGSLTSARLILRGH